jgi:hypothetical protein
VRDKLLNTLQLREMADSGTAQRALVEAAIAQRSRELGPVPFTNAIDLRRNTRYLRYALPPLAVLVLLLFAAPSLITDPARRIIAHGSEFMPEAPFRFIVLNEELVVPEQQDFELEVELEGSVIPQQVELEAGGAASACEMTGPRRKSLISGSTMNRTSTTVAADMSDQNNTVRAVVPKRPKYSSRAATRKKPTSRPTLYNAPRTNRSL